ncbi:MAG: sulfur carrier protein ThiS [Gammaproteobacteria bacterium]|nr:sulfur carrier protein ThiS [Pseudomonadales bacterium]MCP5347614.1 sulfur carrier protein ThiS [Pseudomonadales bacterium]
MEIQVNGKPVTVTEATSLAGLIEQLSLQGGRVAVEVNREIVPRSRYDATLLNSGDQVEIVQAIGGG